MARLYRMDSFTQFLPITELFPKPKLPQSQPIPLTHTTFHSRLQCMLPVTNHSLIPVCSWLFFFPVPTSLHPHHTHQAVLFAFRLKLWRFFLFSFFPFCRFMPKGSLHQCASACTHVWESRVRFIKVPSLTIRPQDFSFMWKKTLLHTTFRDDSRAALKSWRSRLEMKKKHNRDVVCLIVKKSKGRVETEQS